MAEVSIKGAIRNEFGKGASRRIRRDGNVPAVIYGHGEKPTHISLPAREVGVAIKTSNVLLNIDLDGKQELTLPKSIVRNPLKGTLEHIDLIIVRRGERVVVHVPVMHMVSTIQKEFLSTSITPSKLKQMSLPFLHLLISISKVCLLVIRRLLAMSCFLLASLSRVIQRWLLSTSPSVPLLKKLLQLPQHLLRVRPPQLLLKAPLLKRASSL